MAEQTDNGKDFSFPFLREICSDLDDEALKEADERFFEYWKIVRRITVRKLNEKDEKFDSFPK